MAEEALLCHLHIIMCVASLVLSSMGGINSESGEGGDCPSKIKIQLPGK